MAMVIPFEERAVASLRQRLGAAEEDNQDLIAFARGHFGAVASIHQAVLAALGSSSLDELLAVVTREWPSILGIDSVALALIADGHGLRADEEGIKPVDAALVRRAVADVAALDLRSVDRGHPYFGRAARLIRAEALIRIGAPQADVTGLLMLGQDVTLDHDPRHGGSLLLFLGRSLAAMIQRWTRQPPA